MKVLGVSCSPRKYGNSWLLLEEALAGAREAGAETEMLSLSEMEILPCDGCLACWKTPYCHIKDDMRDVYPKVEASDGIIFASPVYFLGMAGQCKLFLDRLYPLYRQKKLANKVGGGIAVATRIGQSQVWNALNLFFAVTHMRPSEFVSGFAMGKGDIKRDKHAMKAAKELGSLVVAIAGNKVAYPSEHYPPLAQCVSEKYGIDMSPAGDRFERP